MKWIAEIRTRPRCELRELALALILLAVLTWTLL